MPSPLPLQAAGELTDEQLFTRVATGSETVIRDSLGRPVSVVIPFDQYLTDRAAAAFNHA